MVLVSVMLVSIAAAEMRSSLIISACKGVVPCVPVLSVGPF